MRTYRILGRGKRQSGFSVIELMVSFAILAIIMGAMTMLMGRLQEIYTSQQRVGGANEMGKTAMELLALDIGQAGFPGIVNTTLTAPVTGSATAQTVTLATMNGIYIGRVLTVGPNTTGTNQESVRVTACTTTSTVANGCTAGASNSVTAVFKVSHIDTENVKGSMNPLPEGVTFDLADTAGTFSSTQSTLRIIGDLRGDGTLRYIEYRFTADASAPTSCHGTLVRSDTDAYQTTQNAAVTVVDNLCNTATQGIFTYTTPCQTGVTLTSTQATYITLVNTDFTPGTTTCRSVGTYTYLDASNNTVTRKLTYVANIGVTLTLQTLRSIELGAGAGGTRQIVFKEQYFSPRNVVDALILDDDGLQTLLPVAPRAALASLPAAP